MCSPVAEIQLPRDNVATPKELPREEARKADMVENVTGH